ncbi:MAG: septum formation initiator family protein [Phascolarctobacterium sp.]|nr:septum formation initiator family protein [Phascolarctobacterium sp.]
MQKGKRRNNKLFTMLLAVVVLSCLVIIGRQEYEIYRLKQEKEATENRIEALHADKAKLELERKMLDDPKYLEKLAREEYNMVGKNEVPLFIVDEKKAAQEPK